jgi:hypothetical protein
MKNKDQILLENAYESIKEATFFTDENLDKIRSGSSQNFSNDEIGNFAKNAAKAIVSYIRKPTGGMVLNDSETSQNRGIELALDAFMEYYFKFQMRKNKQEPDEGDSEFLARRDRIAQDNYEGTRD